jgi:hypothetical protein
MLSFIKYQLLGAVMLLPFFSEAQTQTRDNAGLQGSEGAVSGFFETVNPVNYPLGASSWWHLLDVRHTNTSNNFSMQFSGSFFDQDLFFRKTAENPSQPWSKVLLETNGKVGIGTKVPTGSLEVVGDTNGGQLVVSRNTLVGGEGPGITFTNMINNLKQEKVAGIESQLLNGVVGAVSGSLSFFTIANSAKINAMSVSPLGDVSIGTNDTKGYKFAVAGNMIAESIKVKLQGTWPDFVFAKTYDRKTLQETEKHIKEKGHLPGIPSAEEVKNNGIDLGEMNAKLLQKIEELTLHLIDQEKRIKELEQRKGN